MFKIDPEEYIEDRVLLKQVIKRQDEINAVVAEHMKTGEKRWTQINVQMAVIGFCVLLLLFDVDLRPIAGAIAGTING